MSLKTPQYYYLFIFVVKYYFYLFLIYFTYCLIIFMRADETPEK